MYCKKEEKGEEKSWNEKKKKMSETQHKESHRSVNIYRRITESL